jgi:pilus assembly protein CpaE
MPTVLEPDPTVAGDLLQALPADARTVADPDGLAEWLGRRPEEYAVVLGPGVDLSAALEVCDGLRTTRPTVSVVLVRAELSTEVFAAAMHAGVRDVVATGDLGAVGGAVDRARQLHLALRGPAPATRPSTVITVWSPKGGVGKTTMAVNLAVALAEDGARRVCLVDLDLGFGDVAITMQLLPTHTIEHAIGAEDNLDTGQLEGLLTRFQDSVMVLAAPARPDVRDRITPALVATVLRTLRESFDVVVVDTAPSFDEQTLTAMDATDEMVVVATLDVPTLKNVTIGLETLDMLAIAPGHRRLLLNRADEEAGIDPERVERIVGMRPAARVVTSIEVAAATNAGSPIIVKSPRHPVSLAIAGFAQQLSGRLAGAPTPDRPDSPSVATVATGPTGPGLRGRLWRRR